MALEQQPLGPVANLLPREDEITWLPGLHEAFPPEATRKRLSHLLALDPVGLKADSLLEGLEKRVFDSVVYLDLFVIGDMLAEPVVWHFSGDWGRLPLVATADDLDAPTLEPVEEGFQSVAEHRADLVPDDHTGNEFLSHPFGRPVRLAVPAEEAVIGLGLDAPGPHLFGQAMGRDEDEGVSGTGRARSLACFCRCPRRRLGSSADAGSGDRRGAARCWE